VKTFSLRIGLIAAGLLVLLFGAVALAQATGAPPADPLSLISILVSAAQGHQWGIVAGVALSGLTYVLRAWVMPGWKWAQTDRGGVALALAVSVAGTVSTALLSGTTSWSVLLDAVAALLLSSGAYSVVKKTVAPSDVAKGLLVFVLLIGADSARADGLVAPAFGGCRDTTCYGPSVSLSVLAISLKDGSVSTLALPGLGYGATWRADKWYRYGVSSHFSLRSTSDGQRPQVAIVGSFAEYLRFGLAQVVGGGGTTRERTSILVSFGADFGGSPAASSP